MFEKLNQKDSSYKIDLSNWLSHSESWIFELKQPYTKESVDKIRYYSFLLQIIDEIIYLKREYRLRATQKIAILSALISDSNLLMQIATGEGKSLIIAVIAIIKAIEGETVDVITSSHVLAERDSSKEGLGELYEFFGIEVGHNCDKNKDTRRRAYGKCSVVYGELANFQMDYLLDTYYNETIMGKIVKCYL